MKILINLLIDVGFASLIGFILLTVVVGLVRLISGKGLKSFPITGVSLITLVIALIPALINLAAGRY